MSTEPIVDEDYASSEDSDFAPDEAAGRESSPDSDAGADATEVQAGHVKRKRRLVDGEAEDVDLENSGDEAVIEKWKKKRKRAKDKLDEDEGGDGGLIKTRSQRAQEEVISHQTTIYSC